MFLDRYIRTKDKKLNKDEDSFATLVRDRKIQQRDFINEINQETGKKYQKWEQDYSNRPTYLSNTQFQNLYTEYKKKELAGELTSAYDITNKLDTTTIDNRKVQAETSVRLYIEPAIQEQNLTLDAKNEKKKEDIHFVKEMKRAHDEILQMVKKLKPEDPEDILGIGSSTSENTDEESGVTTTTTVTITGDLVICNFPTFRVDVGESKNHPSHKGLIVEQLGEGGYRFYTKNGYDLITKFELPPPDLDEYENHVNPFLDGSVEWSFNDWLYAYYYTETITTSSSGGSEDTVMTLSDDNEPQITIYLKPLGINKNSFNSKDRARFNELNKRWINFNELRERQVANVGTRYQIESMFNADIPDIKPDLMKVFNDRKEEKQNIINILKEICLFSEFK